MGQNVAKTYMVGSPKQNSGYREATVRAKTRAGPQRRQTIRVKSFEQGPSVQNVDTNAHILYAFGYMLDDFERGLDNECFSVTIELLWKS